MQDNDDLSKSFFGFKQVSAKEKTGLVREVFSSVANKYDVMNNLMSGGFHHLWKDEFCRNIADFHGKILDMACGTGDIGLRCYKLAKASKQLPQLTLCDPNMEMLQQARNKFINKGWVKGVEYVTACAEELPFPDEYFDYYLISFGIRNTTDLVKSLKEARRVLKVGGKFLCLEFSQLQNPMLAPFYDFYSYNIIPQVGGVVTGNKEAYQYLVESIRKFPDQEAFKQLLLEVGFKDVRYHNLNFGVVAIHSGYK